MFLDLHWRQRHTLEFKSTVVIIIFLFFWRIFCHYVGQFLILAIMGVPVTSYEANWVRVELVYASWLFYQDAFVLCFGALSNTFVFIFAVFCSQIWKFLDADGRFPGIWYKILCWQGIFCVLDSPLTFFFDTCAILKNRSFGVQGGYAADSDMYKFYNYFNGLEGNGATGVFLTVFLIFSITMFSGYCFYRYMVFIYKEGRILDLYRRLTGTYKDFFVPHDGEVSLKYLQWILERYRNKDCIILSEMRVQQDKFGQDRNLNFIKIYRIEDGKIMRHRLFFKDFDGSII